jgi:hypothetical protein
MHALVAEAMKKAAIVWLTTDAVAAYPVWCLGIDDALYVVTGGDEQPAPGLAEDAAVTVTSRGDHGGAIVTWRVTVTRVAPGGETWDAVAAPLAAKRLNADGTTEEQLARWAADSAIYRLAPADEHADGGPDAEATSGAAPPRPTPARTAYAKPFRLHKVKRR